MIGSSNDEIGHLMHPLRVLSLRKANPICRRLQVHFPWLRKARRKYWFVELIHSLTHIHAFVIATGLQDYLIVLTSGDSDSTWTALRPLPRSKFLTIHHVSLQHLSLYHTSHSPLTSQICQLLVQVHHTAFTLRVLSNQFNPNSISTTQECKITIIMLKTLRSTLRTRFWAYIHILISNYQS